MSVPDQPDYTLPTLGPISKESRLEWRSTMSNDNGIVNGETPPKHETGQLYRGKFFPRGCRGKIDRIEIYCQNAGADKIKLRFSPEPGMELVDEVSITTPATWAWAGQTWRQFWNYDSLFIWVEYCDPFVDYAYDEVRPYDGHGALKAKKEWWRLNRRYFIRVVYDAETCGDVPVSGTINTIEIPHTGAKASASTATFSAGVAWTTVAGVRGAGYCKFILIDQAATPNGQVTEITIDCDERLIYHSDFLGLNGLGFIASSPEISVLNYAVDGRCTVLLSHRYEFRRRLLVLLRNTFSAGTASVWMMPNVIT